MKFRGHGNGVAIALAGLAVVLAASGTAYAVTATTVNLADPTTPSHIAKVDSSGRLLTVDTTFDSINSGGLLYNITGGDNFVTSPTTANLAITNIVLSESNANTPSAATELRAYLYKVGVDASGNCTSSGYTQLGFWQLSAGDDIVEAFQYPLLVRPTGAAKYCLDLYVTGISTNTSLTWLPGYQLTGYVASGSYAGLGVNAAPAAKPQRATGRADHK